MSKLNLVTAINNIKVGHYQLEKLIGQGGMGKVFLATDIRLHRSVAIKQIKTNFVGEDNNIDQALYIEKSLTEARLLAKMNHPNIVQIHDIHQEYGQVSLVMEYIKGRTLQQFQKEQVLSLVQKLTLIHQISEGLAAAHAQGIIHCDLKPANILIDTNGMVKITDFGIAQLKPRQAINNSNNTNHTKRYNDYYASAISSSPEQLENKTLDVRSDLFSLGMLAFTFIANRHPFQSNKQLTISQAIIAEPPSNAKTILPTIPSALIELLNQLLKKHPDKRPESSQQVAHRFKQILVALSQEEVAAQDTILVTEHKISKKQLFISKVNNKLLVNAAGFLILLLISIWAYLFFSESKHRYVVVLAPKLSSSSKLSDMQKDLVIGSIDDAIRQVVINHAQLQLISREEIRGIGGGLKKVAQATGATDVISTDLHCNNIQCNVTFSHLNGEHWQVIAQKNWPVNVSNYLEIYHNSTSQLSDLFNFNEDNEQSPLNVNEKDYSDYIALYNDIELKGNDSEENLIKLKRLLARSPLLSSGFYLYRETSLELYYQTQETLYLQQLSEVLTNAPATYQQSMLFSIDRILIAITKGELTRADKALAIAKNQGLDLISYHKIKSQWYLANNDLANAIKHTKLALNIRPNTILQYNLATLHYYNSDMTKAKEQLHKLLTLTPNNYRPNQLLADIYLAEGSIASAITAYKKAIKINAQPLDLNNLALSYLLQAQYPKALKYAQQAWNKSPDNSMMLLNLADIQLLSGNTKQAKHFYQQIVSMLAGQETFLLWLDKAQAYAHLHEHKLALQALNNANKLSPNRMEYSYSAALVYALAGEKKSALIQVEEAIKAGYGAIWFNFAWFSSLCEDISFNTRLKNLGRRSHCLKASTIL